MKYYPLSDSFMAVSLLGFIIVTLLTLRARIPADWGIAFIFLFAAGVIASFISVRAYAK